MLEHARFAAPDLARHHHGRRLLVRALELRLAVDIAGRELDAVEAVQEVDVPPVAAELAVGDRLQADVLLQLHRLADRLVLGGLQLAGGGGALAHLLAQVVQLMGTQQAADVVGPEWRFHLGTPYAACFSASALSVASHVKSRSSRPKWP